MLENWKALRLSCDVCSTADSCTIRTHPSMVTNRRKGAHDKLRTYYLCKFECLECSAVTMIEVAAAESLQSGDIHVALLRLAEVEEQAYHDDSDATKNAIVAALTTDLAE